MKAQTKHPTGSVLPLVAVTLTLLLLMLAMVMDLGWINVSKNQLQSAADAAALAAASQLRDEDALHGSPDQSDDIIDSRDNAQTFANYNTAANRSLLIDRNEENDPSGGIVVGYIADPFDMSSVLETTGVATYNSVRVTTRLSETINGPLELFLGAFTGHDTIEVAAQATATLDDRVAGFELTDPDETLGMLPFSIDENYWNTGFAEYQLFGTGIDLFPNDPETPGNFGSIDIGENNNSAADLVRQIADGISQADLLAMGGDEFLLEHDASGKYRKAVNGDTGVSNSVASAFTDIIGETRLIPIHNKVVNPGENAIYTLCGFVGVRIIAVNMTGALDVRSITVEPCQITAKQAIIRPDAEHSQLVYALSLTR